MGDSISHSLLIREEFRLFEEFSDAVVGWELDFCQLSSPEGPFYLEQIQGSGVVISRACFPASFRQLGGSIPGYRTVSILAPGAALAGWRWCGESVTHHSLLVMPVGGEFESVSTPGFDSIHLALPIKLLRRVAETEFQLPLHQLMPDERCFCPHGGRHVARLRDMLLRVTADPANFTGGPRQTLRPSLEREMAYLVLSCLAQGKAEVTPPRSKRMRTLANALDMIASQPTSSMDVAKLVLGTGVSRRTLENAFHDGLGVSPAAYLKALRLRGVHRDLLGADCMRIRVAEVAQSHGFLHLGQLSADYRVMFGELPSETLRRGRR